MPTIDYTVQPCHECGRTTTLATCVSCDWKSARDPIFNRITQMVGQLGNAGPSTSVSEQEFAVASSIRVADVEALMRWLAATVAYSPIDDSRLNDKAHELRSLADHMDRVKSLLARGRLGTAD